MTATLATVFVALYVGHMLGDHVVQTDHQATNKAKPGWFGYRALAGHVLGYTATQFVALLAADLVAGGLPLLGVAAALLFSGATHGFIDRRWPVQWVCRHTGSPNFAALATGGVNGPYLVDQSLHIGCLFVAALIVAGAA